ncbi:GNAT family N-acetyltransferase [Nocardioides sp. GCM10027113]|uniref:GNAT family N-acetyltransferase n=1 Tax=unclassified Nocardioides TaxID=2615069 RepID=UPI0036080A33
MATVDLRPFEDHDAEAVARLSTTVQWPSLTDPDVVRRVCTAPGAVAYVAVHRGEREEVVGWAQAMGDGVLQSHLGFLAVHPDHRRRGIARLLVVATFQATRTKRMDLVTDAAAEPFYEEFGHKRMSGYRIYPGA